MIIFNGIKGILDSKKGTMSLIVLLCSTYAVLIGKLDGPSYAAIVGIVSTIFMWTVHKTDLQAIAIEGHTEDGPKGTL